MDTTEASPSEVAEVSADTSSAETSEHAVEMSVTTIAGDADESGPVEVSTEAHADPAVEGVAELSRDCNVFVGNIGMWSKPVGLISAIIFFSRASCFSICLFQVT